MDQASAQASTAASTSLALASWPAVRSGPVPAAVPGAGLALWAGSGPGAVAGAVTGAGTGLAAGAATTAVGLTFGANNSRIRASLGGTPALLPSSCSALL
ncbi:MAG: hypothetical protein EB007_10190 [Betaproteobacteria bacterium]|nr:hypothetical protein [Betaproteobacteria bacterium]